MRLACQDLHEPIIAIQDMRKPTRQWSGVREHFTQGEIGLQAEETGIVTYQKVARSQAIGLLREAALQPSEPTRRRGPVFKATSPYLRSRYELQETPERSLSLVPNGPVVFRRAQISFHQEISINA